MSALNIVIAGAGGRMGQTLIREIAGRPDCVLAGATERAGAPALGQDAGTLAGLEPLGIAVSADPLPLLAKADALIDFTSPAASVVHAALAAQARIIHIIGTTGFSPAEEDKLAAAARHATIVRSGNFSLGVNLLAALARKAAGILGPEFDIEILEFHHRHKVDAPSGTALLLGKAVAAGRGVDFEEKAVLSREGKPGAREAGTIGFATLRGGSVVGEHSVIFAAERERLVLSHIAEDRTIFARGAIHAALWAHGKKPGLYSMADVLALD
jgi:4-hydroxy-tetrahydrodipicolinate reductase